MDDAALVFRAKEGHEDAIETLLSLHESVAYTAALRLLGEPADAQDVMQDALVRAYTHLGDLEDNANFAAWLRKIAVNLSLNVMRRRGILRFESLEQHVPNAQTIDDASVSPELSAMNADLRQQIEALVRQLPPDQRVAVVLRDMYDYDVAEIARAQRCGLSAAKMRIARGRAHLRALLVDARIDARGSHESR